ncbi:16S rRNA (guanine(966)-N(2))-methyltransferase RsmD [Parablautia muri]|uniref:16S rRNA (Guanine(966)-N(2))-methyltransferase RsmD n=1 Tax=Parablautia muri TaxID=2320879 RepID=A0A9X5BCU8_9FIRM|nr:16S rRNA (guanine(966)-N(2))-methyltransferase RsmD [Parablautia muri]NBJ91485.1 16S rRNA (guanine(966)-N(2))-methyltransferase RsmD [Parablautia muri]
MRVIAGRARSLQLRTPEGSGTRPTTDRIKETLFNMIQWDISGCIFVDLFAGSGGIGIEALSRGASHAYFVENGREAISCIQENLTFTKFADNATLLKQDVFTALSMIHEKEVDFVFIDPPYQADYEERIFELLFGQPYVTEHTLLILEAEKDKKLDFLADQGYEIVKEKVYKTNKHVFVRKA